MHRTTLVSFTLLLVWCIAIVQGQYDASKALREHKLNNRNSHMNKRQKQQLRAHAATGRSFSEKKRFHTNLRELNDALQQLAGDESDGISYTRPIESPTCGRTQTTPKFEGRIVGGHEAVPHSWPWQVLFEAGGTCGGTLINAEYVLTAAHCIGTEDLSEITITAGLHSLEQNENTETTRQVRQAQQVTVHPGYNSDTIKNDLALVRLAEPVEFNENVQPACLPGPDPKPDSEVVLIGWGVTSTGGELSPVLKQTEVQVIDHCDQHWEEVDDATQLCFKDKTLTSAACQGDSGGPALQEHEGQWVVEGVTSFGHRICEVIQHGLPDVYTRVSAFLPWIHSVIDQ
ncbi:unnamed protein product [Rotaria magnacalcarata]|uniref:Peptidase S1 domain-containing protein n=1 Tax=Rotaria magnacalcarata TaxID=392030 RepID=A0A816XBF5_9BILA|nr:unnamed protein product [Rotaria magnacalcarata]CAF4143663.1 unnamed protein product [Rotaria magnacalcarata]